MNKQEMKALKRLVSIALTVILLLMAALPALAEENIVLDDDFWKADEHKSVNLGKENFYIKIDTKHNRITVYQRINGEWKALAKKKCATGTKETPTPKGEFRVTGKSLGFNKAGARWNYVTYFFEDYAIHSTGEIDGEYNNHSLGKNASLGCVRLKPGDAKWIYDNIPIGTAVEIV